MAEKKPTAKTAAKPKYVSQCIDLKKDILAHRVVCIRAGVGSGKNTWARQLVDPAYTDGKKCSVLYITSRKAVANSEAEKLGAARTIKLDDFVDADDLSAVSEAQRIVYATNSTIESFMSKTYLRNADKPEAHIWNKLDFCIIDECHSLTTDATFSSAPYYVDRFIRLAYEENPDLHFIFMTGTTEPVNWFFKDLKSKGIDVHDIDLYDKCKCVRPEIIMLYQKEPAQQEIRQFLKDGKKIIYFVRKISDISSFYKSLTSGSILPKEAIGVAFSKDEKAENFEDSKDIKKSKEDLADYIKSESKLPDEIRLFMSTSQNKEGVNIENEDIDYMFVESTLKNEIIQMAGRARKGIKKLYVIYDSDFASDSALYEEDRDGKLLPHLNAVLDTYRTGTKTVTDCKPVFISETEHNYPNIRHDPFLKESKDGFVLYDGRIEGNVARKLNHEELLESISKWNEVCTFFDADSYDPNYTFQDYIRDAWFPHCLVALSEKDKKSVKDKNREDADREIKETLKSKGWFLTKILDSDTATQKAIIDTIHEINAKYKTGRSDKHSSVGKALATCGLKWDPIGGKDAKKTKEPKHWIIEKD